MSRRIILAIACSVGMAAVPWGLVACQSPTGETPTGSRAKEAHPFTGRWRIEYHPNAAVREYTINADGCVVFTEFPDWKGKLAGGGGPSSSSLLRFEGDPTDRVERITLVADGRLLVEHYNPGTDFASERRPDQIGLGVRVR